MKVNYVYWVQSWDVPMACVAWPGLLIQELVCIFRILFVNGFLTKLFTGVYTDYCNSVLRVY